MRKLLLAETLDEDFFADFAKLMPKLLRLRHNSLAGLAPRGCLTAAGNTSIRALFNLLAAHEQPQVAEEKRLALKQPGGWLNFLRLIFVAPLQWLARLFTGQPPALPPVDRSKLPPSPPDIEADGAPIEPAVEPPTEAEADDTVSDAVLVGEADVIGEPAAKPLEEADFRRARWRTRRRCGAES